MSSSYVLQNSTSLSSLHHPNGLPFTSTSTLTGWSHHRFYSRQAAWPAADIGGTPVHSLSRRSSHSSMSREMVAAVSGQPSSSSFRGDSQECKHKLSRSQSSSSRVLSDWVRRRKGENKLASAESPLSNAVRGLTLPPVNIKAGAESMEELVEVQQSSTKNIASSSSSNGGHGGGGLSRMFSARRKQRTSSMNDDDEKNEELGRMSPSKSLSSDYVGTIPNTSGLVKESSCTLQTFDLSRSMEDAKNISSANVPSSSPFTTLLRKGSRLVRTRSTSKDGMMMQTEQFASPQKQGGTRRKLSVAGLNLFRPNVQNRGPPTTPEIKAWKEKTPASRSFDISEEQKQQQVKSQEEDSFQIRSNSAETELSSRALLTRSSGPLRRMTDDQIERLSISDEDRRVSALGLIPGAGRDSPEFTAGLNAISSSWTEASSTRTSTSRRRKPVPQLDLSGLAGGDSTMESTLPSLRTNNHLHRPYSLISTDDEANDTPIVRLQNFVVDTKENNEEETMKQSQLFFRPLNENGTTRISPRTESSGQEIEYIHSRQSPEIAASASEAGALAKEASVLSSGSSTLNVRLISAQMQKGLQVRQGEAIQTAEDSKRVSIYSLPPDREEENELQYQQLSPPRHARVSAMIPIHSTHDLLEFKQESGTSCRTESPEYEAVLSRAVSTRLQSVPLRRMNVEEWARQLALADKGMDMETANFQQQVEVPDAIQDIPDESTSSRDNLVAVKLTSKAEEKGQQSSANLSEAARLGKVPSKRFRTDEGSEDGIESDRKMSEPVEEVPLGDKMSRHRRNDTNESQRTMTPIKREIASKEQKSREDMKYLDKETKVDELQSIGSMTDLNTKDAKNISRRRAGQEQSLSNKKTYLTSEEATIAKRKEKKERERNSKEKRRQKEMDRQKAYAERKRNDPLLRTRLALVGLASADDEEERGEAKGFVSNGQLYNMDIKTKSSTESSRTSFHTAHEEEEEEEERLEVGQAGSQKNKRAETLSKQAHRRNQASTASDATILTLASRSSFDTLATSAVPFPEPPRRHDKPTRSEDGTVLARARLLSSDGLRDPLLAVDQAQSISRNDDHYKLITIGGHKVVLSNGALVRNSPALIKKPDFNDKNKIDNGRLSQVPEIHDRFSVQSFAN